MEFEVVIRKLEANTDRINVLYRWLTKKEYSKDACESLCAYLLDNKALHG